MNLISQSLLQLSNLSCFCSLLRPRGWFGLGEILVLMLRDRLMKFEVADARGMRRRRVLSFILSWRKAVLEDRNRMESLGLIEVR